MDSDNFSEHLNRRTDAQPRRDSRVGDLRVREFRTVHASKALRAIAGENDLSKTTLQHIKSVLSGIFTHAKNEGAFDGANPIQGARIPSNAREPGETYAYNLAQICRILEALPLLPKAVVATASYAGLREGELRGLEWPDYTGAALNVNRSIWKNVVNRPKTRASAAPVPVIRQLADILNAYRSSMGNPKTGVVFHVGAGKANGLRQTGSASHPSSGRSNWAGMVWLAWVPAWYCVEFV